MTTSNSILSIAVQEELRKAFEGDSASTKCLERRKSLLRQFLGDLPGPIEAHNRWVSGLLRFSVFSGSFSELFRSLSDIENVVDHLECEINMIAKVGQGFELSGRAICAHTS